MLGFSVIGLPFRRMGAALAILTVVTIALTAVTSAAGAGSAVTPLARQGVGGPGEAAVAADGVRAASVDPASPVAPAAALALTAPGVDPSAVSLSWSGETTTDFVNYSVEEASAASAWKLSVVQTITAGASTTSTVVSALAPGVDYDWQVVENYETCLIIICNPASESSNLLNLTQPGAAFLNTSDLTSSSVTLNWTNNATYGGSIAFGSYEVYESKNRASPTLLSTITSEATESFTASLSSGQAYSFLVDTIDCISGCGSGSSITSQSNLVTAGSLLSLEVTVFAQRTTIDLGQFDLFTCTPTGGKSPFTYSWQFGSTAGFVAGNASQAALLGATDVQSITCKVTDDEPSTQTGVVDVQVDPTLVVAASINRTAADVGQAAAFTCYATGGTSPYALDWSFGDGVTSTTGNTTHAYAESADYAPSCQVSDPTGASLDPAFPIVVSPSLGTGAAASSSAAAPGTALTFSAAPVNGSGTYSRYAWTFPGGGTASGRTVSYAFVHPGTDVAAVTVTDSNGATARSNVSVQVSYVSASVSAPAGSAHTGSALSFAASASGGAGGPYNFTWSFGDGSTAYGPTVEHTYASTGTVQPTLVVKDRLGATNTTHLAAIVLTTPPGPLAGFATWLILAIGIAVAAVVGLLVLSRRRAVEAGELAAGSPYVPPTDPKRTIQGRKVCPSCGATNLPIRSTCSRCGKPLPRTSG
jgi:hypothetical protein